jgi:hypothetical protein
MQQRQQLQHVHIHLVHTLMNFSKALEHHTQHLAIAKELGDRAGQGRACTNLGMHVAGGLEQGHRVPRAGPGNRKVGTEQGRALLGNLGNVLEPRQRVSVAWGLVINKHYSSLWQRPQCWG